MRHNVVEKKFTRNLFIVVLWWSFESHPESIGWNVLQSRMDGDRMSTPKLTWF